MLPRSITPKLPDGYTRVSYIKSEPVDNVSAYMETDYIPIIGDCVHATFTHENSGHAVIFSAGTDSYQFVLLPARGSEVSWYYAKYFATGDALSFNVTTPLASKWHTIDIDSSGTTRIDDHSPKTSTPTAELDGSQTNLWLFRRRNSGQSNATIKISEFYIYNGDHYKMYMIPCIRNSDNIVGMYDAASNKFYGHAGATPFAAGDICEESRVNQIQALHKSLSMAPHLEQVSNTLAHFKTDISAPLKDCKIHFNPIQDLHGYDHPWIGGTGKNLFNINAIEQNPDDTTATNTTARNFTAGTYCVGTSWSNWLQPNQVLEHSVSDGILSIKNNNVYGVGYVLKVEPETDYTISATSSNGGINAAFYDASGNFISGLSMNLLNTSFATPVDADIVVLTFYNRNEGSDAAAATFSNIQFEKGTAVTAWEPYENICPITGFTDTETYHSGKSLVRFQTADRTTTSYYNGFNGWLLDGYWKIPDRTKTYIYSAYLDNKDGTAEACVKIWFRNKDNDAYEGIVYGTKIQPGEEGWSTLVFGNNDARCYAGFGLDMRPGCIARNGMVELGDTRTEYEPYNGTAIPITFPSVINMLNFTTITANKTLYAEGEEISENGMSLTDYIKVNEGDTYKLTFTSKEGARTRRIWSYNANKEPIEQLASVSWVTVDTVGFIQATIPSGVEYIRICYKTADENIFLEGPESSVIYGGYVDLVTGEVWETHKKISITQTMAHWNTWGNSLVYNTGIMGGSNKRKAGTIVLCDYLTPIGGTVNPQYVTSTDEIRYYGVNTTYPQYLFMANPDHLTIQEWRSWLETTYPNAHISFELETPVLVTTLAPTQLKTLKGINNIWSDANGPIEVKYWTH